MAVVGYLGWYSLANRYHVKGIRQQWRTQYTKDQILLAPILALYYGNEPRTTYVGLPPTGGALGLTDEAVIFQGRDHIVDPVIPFTALRWIGTHTIYIGTHLSTTEKNALIIHYEEPVLQSNRLVVA